MKPPQEGRNRGAPSLRGLQGRSATGLNGQAAKDEVSAVWRGAGCRKIFLAFRQGRSVFHLTSPFIGLLGKSADSRAKVPLQSSSSFRIPCTLCRYSRAEQVGSFHHSLARHRVISLIPHSS